MTIVLISTSIDCAILKLVKNLKISPYLFVVLV